MLLAAGIFESGSGVGKLFEQIPDVDLQLTPPDQVNRLDVTVTATAMGMTRSDSDTANVTGNMLTTLGIDFHQVTHEVTRVDELEFTGGTLRLSNVSLTLNYGLFGRVEASGTGIGGTLDTPNPPGTVSNGSFNTAEHLVLLNQGQFDAHGTGAIGGLFDPVTIDLAQEPIEATTDMTGFLDVSLQTVAGNVGTYDVTLTLPVDYDAVVYDEGGTVVTVSVVGTLEAAGQFTRALPQPAEVRDRHVFYSNSAFDGNGAAPGEADDAAIAPDKAALMPGETATFDNYTSYTRGINGVMIDVENLPQGITLDAGDFQFRVGNSNNPSTWAPAPAPSTVTVRRGDGTAGSDRVTLIWPDQAIQKQWLQVTIPAGGDVGLVQPDAFYFGNAVGESGNSAAEAKVNATDMVVARNNQHTFINPAPLDDFADFDRDKKVNATDMLIARNNQTSFLDALQLITVPASKAAGGEGGTPEEPSLGKFDWLYEYESMGRCERSPAGRGPAQEAVDRLLAPGSP